jgi:hypothetical protein
VDRATISALGSLWRRPNADGALTGIATGVVSAAFFLRFSDSKWMAAIYFLYAAAIIN